MTMLSLKGSIVTVDSLNCQREISRKIVDTPRMVARGVRHRG